MPMVNTFHEMFTSVPLALKRLPPSTGPRTEQRLGGPSIAIQPEET